MKNRDKNIFSVIVLFFILCSSMIIIGEDKKNTKSLNTYKSIAAGENYTIVIKFNGTLWSWGENKESQLGNGTAENKDSPTQIGTETKWSKVYAGGVSCLALKSDGTLWAWGNNLYGQLGNGSTEKADKPIQVGTDTNWADISIGGATVLALKTDHTLWAWGYNEYGQVGDGTTENKKIPVQIGKDKDWVKISTVITSFAIKSNGTLWGWGRNSDAQLGDGTQDDKNKPTQIGKDTDWIEIAAGSNHTVAIKKDGSIWSWGRDGAGLLGNGVGEPGSFKKTPNKIGKLTTCAKVWTDAFHTFVLKADKTLWAWGAQQVFFNSTEGNGTGKLPVYNNFPTKIGNDNNWLTVSAAFDHMVALKTDGTLWAWGKNTYGQLGDGTKINRDIPVQIK
jgi:alpha-tubulin suppressor-like RCC1 family protein